jgi:hypothetical protein
MILHTYMGGIYLLIVAFTTNAQPWELASPVDVTTTSGPGIFHHLDSSGRRNIVVSGNTVAVVWEDNRNGTPHIYLARKPLSAKAFPREDKISGKGEAYDPSLVALNDGRFVVSWEENSRIHVRLVTSTGLGPTLILGQSDSIQASLVRHQQQLILVYSQIDAKQQRVWLQLLAQDGLKLRKLQDCPIDREPAKDDQLYPVAISLGERTIVAWEDRRPGHTIIMAAQNNNESPCNFTSPQRISEAPKVRNASYGKGHGVARVVLGRYGSSQVVAVWADKRDFREGYDIYAAHYQSGGKNLFGVNGKVQDSFGGIAQQWHPAVAGNDSGNIVVAWDDNRDGDANIMLSWLEGNDWSDDMEVMGATGQGEQSHPSIYLDDDANLHMVWIERSKIGAPTRLRYLFGKVVKNKKSNIKP